MIFPASLYYSSQFTNPALSMTNYSQTNRKKLPLRRWEPAVSFSLVSGQAVQIPDQSTRNYRNFVNSHFSSESQSHAMQIYLRIC